MSCVVTKLHTSVKDFSARGGASIVEVAGKIIVFGGADREQTHFQDLMVYGGDAGSNFRTIKCTGDVPMPRSGHAVVAYGKFMFLSGGIDFAEEAVFNDLYILDTDTFEWDYVGESGEEVVARNSHSLGVVTVEADNYLVLYGGASPEHGPMGDTLYAKLPALSDIDKEAVYVQWATLHRRTPTTSAAEPTAPVEGSTVFTSAIASAETPQRPRAQPGSREMHGTCCCNGMMVITGGRNGNGEILSDTWILAASAPVSDSPEHGSAAVDGVVPSRLEWRRSAALELPMARCAHGAAAIVSSGTSAAPSWSIVLSGGFTAGGISEDVIRATLPGPDDVDETRRWSTLEQSAPLTGRFGAAACSISLKVLSHLAGNKKYAPVFSARAKALVQVLARGEVGQEAGVAVVLFGGVCIEQDFGDLHLLLVC